MTDRDVVERAAQLMGSRVWECRSKNPKYKPTFKAVVRGGSAVVLMELLHDHMGNRRRQRIDDVIARYDPRLSRKRRRWPTVAEMVEAREGRSLRTAAKILDVSPEYLRRNLLATQSFVP